MGHRENSRSGNVENFDARPVIKLSRQQRRQSLSGKAQNVKRQKNLKSSLSTAVDSQNILAPRFRSVLVWRRPGGGVVVRTALTAAPSGSPKHGIVSVGPSIFQA